ncbi:arabinan endo-1,5-alpha-L-arabinosidase [Croceibacterium sp. TMG7-5b_MA50]|uniref:arabinan endo-1,5-alpha-L-arabinosidase n=1 Tax=Croceibacterium sp. TMG7-5b_MA50 TaxID=3121290 RepID=UPI0032220317
MRKLAAGTATALLFALAACGGDDDTYDGDSLLVAPTPTPAPAPLPSPSSSPSPAPSPSPSGTLALTGATGPVHDPAILNDNGTFYLFATGNNGDREGLLALRTSPNLTDWTLHGGSYTALPAWTATEVPGTGGMWAPDIVKVGGEYRLYYSISRFGENRSAIGMAVATSINPAAPATTWQDRGPVIQSRSSDNYNAIDPAVFTDADGRMWMAFGSFWTGIKLIELDPATGMRRAGDTIRSIASRPFPGAVEAPFVVRRGGFYYLFVSFDACCQGAASTYNTRVGRSASPTGPYLDRDGRSMMDGGGTVVLESGQGTGSRYVGRGHVAVVANGGQDYIVHHAYDTTRNGFPVLQIQRLDWADGWPVAR